MREKDTNSELNTFDDRDQEVFIANFYWQDFFWKGYTAQWSLHANFDHGGTHYDETSRRAAVLFRICARAKRRVRQIL